jgi:hypothetical protein
MMSLAVQSPHSSQTIDQVVLVKPGEAKGLCGSLQGGSHSVNLGAKKCSTWNIFGGLHRVGEAAAELRCHGDLDLQRSRII